MSKEALRPRLSAEDYFQLPETNQPMALLNGELLTLDAPSPEHQMILLKITMHLYQQIQQGQWLIAPTDVLVDLHNVIQPDLCWVAPQRLDIIDKRLMAMPDFVLEVLSPSTVKRDRGAKFTLYEQYGVRELWLVDPKLKSIEVWERVGEELELHGAYTLGEQFSSPLFANAFNVDDLFS